MFLIKSHFSIVLGMVAVMHWSSCSSSNAPRTQSSRSAGGGIEEDAGADDRISEEELNAGYERFEKAINALGMTQVYPDTFDQTLDALIVDVGGAENSLGFQDATALVEVGDPRFASVAFYVDPKIEMSRLALKDTYRLYAVLPGAPLLTLTGTEMQRPVAAFLFRRPARCRRSCSPPRRFPRPRSAPTAVSSPTPTLDIFTPIPLPTLAITPVPTFDFGNPVPIPSPPVIPFPTLDPSPACPSTQMACVDPFDSTTICCNADEACTLTLAAPGVLCVPSTPTIPPLPTLPRSPPPTFVPIVPTVVLPEIPTTAPTLPVGPTLPPFTRPTTVATTPAGPTTLPEPPPFVTSIPTSPTPLTAKEACESAGGIWNGISCSMSI